MVDVPARHVSELGGVKRSRNFYMNKNPPPSKKCFSPNFDDFQPLGFSNGGYTNPPIVLMVDGIPGIWLKSPNFPPPFRASPSVAWLSVGNFCSEDLFGSFRFVPRKDQNELKQKKHVNPLIIQVIFLLNI